jgi:hypothetical protein
MHISAMPSKFRVWLVFLLLLVVMVVCSSVADASAAQVTWNVQAQAGPTQFQQSDAQECSPNGPEERCDGFMVSVQNIGGGESPDGLTVVDRLPKGYTTVGPNDPQSNSEAWGCGERTLVADVQTVKCVYSGPVAAGSYAPALRIYVDPPADEVEEAVVENMTRAEGGGAPVPSVRETTVSVNGAAATFGVKEVVFEPADETGLQELGAGIHPWALSAGFFSPTVHTAPKGTGASSNSLEGPYQPVRNIKTMSFELPFGMAGDPLSTEQCTEAEFDEQGLPGTSTKGQPTNCPANSAIGTLALAAGALGDGELGVSGEECCTKVFNIKPQKGYPAELGFKFLKKIPVYLYPSVIRAPSGVRDVPPGYRLRVVASGIPSEIELDGAVLTIYGQTKKINPISHKQESFLTNPDQCSGELEHARVELESWREPGITQEKETVAYPQLTGCSLLSFTPTLGFRPTAVGEGPEVGTETADSPSAFTVDLHSPQDNAFSDPGTPAFRTATVMLPAGVTLNPAAGSGLVGCQATGPEGINIGSQLRPAEPGHPAETGPFGQDRGDPEATELGAGHPGGDGSPYDDGVYHTAPGHCPAGSTVGTAEVTTPLLPEPLKGKLFVAAPKCGGAGQPACTEASATNGELYGGYLEVSGDGVIAKVAGTFAANPATGQITAYFKENPELPIEDVKLQIDGGARAPLANPQTCGNQTTSSVIEPWSAPLTPNAIVSSSFAVTGCSQGGMGFSPGFLAETTSSAAGAFSPFTLTFSRQDGEQDLAGIQVTTPPGFAAMLSTVTLCGEPQAAQGTCPASSRIGSVSAAAGAGSSPLWLGGQAYLTGPYNGAPFGLSIVVPAVAGPFNLGNVVERAAITVNPHTAAVTITSGPLTQIKDGIPIRLRTVNVTVDGVGGNNKFTFNPTSCAQQAVTATIAATQGASANVATPFAATGCSSLPFKPTLTVSSQGRTSKLDGASLTVKVSSKAGEANIHRVDLTIPTALPSRLTTLQKACTEAQFNANPAGCPEGSFIGSAKAVTPVLSVPLEGPAILVSHGGAAFPDVEFVLQGEGVTVVIDGGTQIKKGLTYSKFETVPDAPISSFETVLPEGPHSVLSANGNLCTPTTTKTVLVKKRITERVKGHNKRVTKKVKQSETVPVPLTIPTTIVGQNGAQIVQSTKVAVTGCSVVKKAAVKKATKKESKGVVKSK